ncbi:YvcK family protein [Candidatus Falkowbacteria bacterium CG_4_9_14_3_um_filter_36_9]|uniref:Putative gluconeogenesis factor n=1 Tax=Candidatus Falkowbacteria bacterium CG02_land_8_20_14_3_00_36_14 TaxID=1974560 RepID=A0A2M7DQY1_9BACT|nr:MAG: YvcK family protein [Candidatus Falkowbacteria bacterium CG02_land_8_20_14_3_00_36_14]PJA10640.1 MAG: YvcK family protein [Candidatus Falkowbacteria bacterium CG_4_10_14_0_2_um_filter_36_22]PJB18398.1 MAG: YvcK family protein [Candidatus Falkowbacteria bacterium CG_4_9_14_3_um_filter_36_9]
MNNSGVGVKKIVTIGGGTGQFNLLCALRDIIGIKISAVVSMVDSGGSTGRLRDELGVLPPGDILKCILALSADREAARKILQKRFNSNSRLSGHSVGNLLLTILSQYAGNFPEGVKALGEALDIKGNVLPVTIDKATLVAELTDGSFLYGETAIDIPRGGQRERIKTAFLVPHHSDQVKVYPPVQDAIKNADLIIIGPGDLFTSTIPNFLVPGVKEALHNSLAEILFVVNIMTKFGETDNFGVKDFVERIEEFIGKKVNKVLVNSQKPENEVLEKYKEQKAKFIEVDLGAEWAGRKIIAKDLIDLGGEIIRHNPEKLKEAVEEIIN